MIRELQVGKKYFIKGKEWDWLNGQHIPVLIKKEYKHFYIADVLPHYYQPFNFGLSRPYSITINKAALTATEKATIFAYQYKEKYDG